MKTSFSVSQNLVKYYCRATYYITPEGEEKLAQVQQLDTAAFRLAGYEKIEENAEEIAALEEGEKELSEEEKKRLYALRALRRAKINAFLKILCNPDLDTFATFTLSPEMCADRSDYKEAYACLRGWLCNRVNRRGLKYVICPERHEKGGIHFHAIMNSTALRLTPAISPHTGKPLTNNGNPLYNISDFPYGFTSAEIIQNLTLDRERVAKYIFKYMGKQGIEGMIGGRYALIGGKLREPIYRYSDNPQDFLKGLKPTHSRTVEQPEFIYNEWSFI